LNHPNGDFRDWTQLVWDTNLNNENHFMMKNGRVEVAKPGLYFVYAQVRSYYILITIFIKCRRSREYILFIFGHARQKFVSIAFSTNITCTDYFIIGDFI